MAERYSPDISGAENYNDYIKRMEAQRVAQLKASPEVEVPALSGLSSASDAGSSTFSPAPDAGKDMAQGFARGASGGLASGLMGAGIAGMAGGAGLTAATGGLAAGGLALSYLEQRAKAKQMQQEAEARAEQEKKKAQMDAINQMINVSKGLTLGA